MDFARLKRKGWTKDELERAERILARAEKEKPTQLTILEHALLWLVVITLIIGSVAVVTELLPLILLASMAFTVPVVFVMGSCLGLLFVHVLHDLRMEKIHHHAGTAVLLVGMVSATSILVGQFAGRFDVAQTAHAGLGLALVFAAGVLIPYVAHWRLTHGPA